MNKIFENKNKIKVVLNATILNGKCALTVNE